MEPDWQKRDKEEKQTNDEEKRSVEKIKSFLLSGKWESLLAIFIFKGDMSKCRESIWPQLISKEKKQNVICICKHRNIEITMLSHS